MAPLVSVVIINHNGIAFVEDCLKSVLSNNYPSFEVIFVDNNSTDGSLEFVKQNFSQDHRLKTIENKASLGPAVGRNKGIAIAKGKYVAFLDNDTEADPAWLSELVKVFESDPEIGAAQIKLLKTEPRDTFDYAGDYLTPLGFLSERARGAKDIGQFDYVCDIFSAKSAAMAIRKDVLDKIGGFDEDFYMYLEETDICWRVWLSGYRVVFSPKSIVYHAYGTKKKLQSRYYPNYTVRYYGCRNYITTLLKNLGTINLIKILPLQILSFFVLAFMFLLKLKFKDFILVLKAIGWNFFNLGLILKKRRFNQTVIRKISDDHLMHKIMIEKTTTYYFGKAFSYISGRPF